MKKNQVLGIIRNLLIVAFAFLSMHFEKTGVSLPEGWEAEYVMSFMTVIVLVWGIVDKTQRGAKVWSSLLRSTASIIAGLTLAFGWSHEMIDTILMAIGTIISIITMGNSVVVNGKIQNHGE